MVIQFGCGSEIISDFDLQVKLVMTTRAPHQLLSTLMCSEHPHRYLQPDTERFGGRWYRKCLALPQGKVVSLLPVHPRKSCFVTSDFICKEEDDSRRGRGVHDEREQTHPAQPQPEQPRTEGTFTRGDVSLLWLHCRLVTRLFLGYIRGVDSLYGFVSVHSVEVLMNSPMIEMDRKRKAMTARPSPGWFDSPTFGVLKIAKQLCDALYILNATAMFVFPTVNQIEPIDFGDVEESLSSNESQSDRGESRKVSRV